MLKLDKCDKSWQVWKKHAKIYQMRKNVDQKQSALYLNMVMSMYSSVKKKTRSNIRQAQSTLYMNTCVRYGHFYVLLCKKCHIIVKKIKWGERSTKQLLRQRVWFSTPELEKETDFKSTNILNVWIWTLEDTVVSWFLITCLFWCWYGCWLSKNIL